MIGIADRQIQVCEMEHAEFKVQKITAAELVQGEILGQTDSQMQEKLLKEWDSRKIYDEEIHEILTEDCFRYPFEYLKDLPVKVSVSELKKRSWQGEEEKEESLFYEPDIQEIIPTFVSGEKEEYRGAARGTAYHRLMEMSGLYTCRRCTSDPETDSDAHRQQENVAGGSTMYPNCRYSCVCGFKTWTAYENSSRTKRTLSRTAICHCTEDESDRGSLGR